jgi:hypothetical protein
MRQDVRYLRYAGALGFVSDTELRPRVSSCARCPVSGRGSAVIQAEGKRLVVAEPSSRSVDVLGRRIFSEGLVQGAAVYAQPAGDDGLGDPGGE